MTEKALALVLLLGGELLTISLELLAARSARRPLAMGSTALAFAGMALAGVALFYSYRLGYRVFDNIWIVMVLSIASITVIEPVAAFLLFSESPSRGAALGFVLGVSGMGCALLWK